MDTVSRRRCLGLLAASPGLLTAPPALLAGLSLPATSAQAQSLPPRTNRLRPWEPLGELPLLAAALQRLAHVATRMGPGPSDPMRPPTAPQAAFQPSALCPTWRLGLHRTEQALRHLQGDARLMLAHLPERFPERARREALSGLADELAHNSHVLASALEGLFPLLQSLPDARAIEQLREIIFVLAYGQRARGYSLTTLQIALRRWKGGPEEWNPGAMSALLRQALEAIDQCLAPLAVLAHLQPPQLEESAPECNR